ncbi:hypothetical protein [Bacillus changyiensis]|uniref:hypothetical protein n=1 Tax=Bacillus changyiensis TaxID=3004103 RepID=UPI0022E3AE8E|nr:hypothetical protein [Bacillus changyiensis]MDA1476762.1 hypothetical protein [Bacillus changyiensis]
MDQKQQNLTAIRLKKIADHIEDTREEYNYLLLQVQKLVSDKEKTILDDEKVKEKLSSTYQQMKEYALFVKAIEAFLRTSARNIKREDS